MNKLDLGYQALLKDILDNGVEKKDRTGTGTLSVFGRQIRHKMSDGFPLITTKKMPFKTIVTELLWFLNGDTNIKDLVDNGCNIWNGDAYKRFCNEMVTAYDTMVANNPTRDFQPFEVLLSLDLFIKKIKTDDDFANKWGNLGPIYGAQWRKWENTIVNYTLTNGNKGKSFTERNIDQISILIKDLKTNPDSRRLMVNAWNVSDLDQMVLPPCHYGFQVYTRELSVEERIEELVKRTNSKEILPFRMGSIEEDFLEPFNIPKRALSLIWNQRSVDTFLGLPFNIASYGLLLEILAKEVNMIPDELIGNLGDTHLYLNHLEQAKEQIGKKMTSEERNQWHLDVRCGGDKTASKIWADYELDQQDVPTHTRTPYPLPTLFINTEFWQTETGECGIGKLATNLKGFEISDFSIEEYKSHTQITAELSN